MRQAVAADPVRGWTTRRPSGNWPRPRTCRRTTFTASSTRWSASRRAQLARRLRLERAADRLRRTAWPVARIAREAGYLAARGLSPGRSNPRLRGQPVTVPRRRSTVPWPAHAVRAALPRSGNTQHRPRSGNTQHRPRSGNTQHRPRSGNRQHFRGAETDSTGREQKQTAPAWTAGSPPFHPVHRGGPRMQRPGRGAARPAGGRGPPHGCVLARGHGLCGAGQALRGAGPAGRRAVGRRLLRRRRVGARRRSCGPIAGLLVDAGTRHRRPRGGVAAGRAGTSSPSTSAIRPGCRRRGSGCTASTSRPAGHTLRDATTFEIYRSGDHADPDSMRTGALRADRLTRLRSRRAQGGHALVRGQRRASR